MSTFPYDEKIPAGAPNAGKTPRALIEAVLTNVGDAYNRLNEAINSPDGELSMEQVAEELHEAAESLDGVVPEIREALKIATTIITFGQGARS